VVKNARIPLGVGPPLDHDDHRAVRGQGEVRLAVAAVEERRIADGAGFPTAAGARDEMRSVADQCEDFHVSDFECGGQPVDGLFQEGTASRPASSTRCAGVT